MERIRPSGTSRRQVLQGMSVQAFTQILEVTTVVSQINTYLFIHSKGRM